MKALKDYVRSTDVDKIDGVIRSVNITRGQAEYLKRRNVNLSKLVRDVIDDMLISEMTDVNDEEKAGIK